MGNIVLVVLFILVIVGLGHLYIKNVLLNNTGKGNVNTIKPELTNQINNKQVTFGDKEVRYIPNNDTLNKMNNITPPDNIILNEAPLELESQLQNHIDSMYVPEKIVYNEEMFKKDNLGGYSKDSNLTTSFSDFSDNTNYYPYKKNDRELINKYNEHSESHFTDDNIDLNSFFDRNQRFNDNTSAFVDGSEINRPSTRTNKELIGPPIINSEEMCDPYNRVTTNDNILNNNITNSEIVDVNGEQLESWNYSNEKVINGGKIHDGLGGFQGFGSEIYSNISDFSKDTEGKCMQ